MFIAGIFREVEEEYAKALLRLKREVGPLARETENSELSVQTDPESAE